MLPSIGLWVVNLATVAWLFYGGPNHSLAEGWKILVAVFSATSTVGLITAWRWAGTRDLLRRQFGIGILWSLALFEVAWIAYVQSGWPGGEFVPPFGLSVGFVTGQAFAILSSFPLAPHVAPRARSTLLGVVGAVPTFLIFAIPSVVDRAWRPAGTVGDLIALLVCILGPGALGGALTHKWAQPTRRGE